MNEQISNSFETTFAIVNGTKKFRDTPMTFSEFIIRYNAEETMDNILYDFLGETIMDACYRVFNSKSKIQLASATTNELTSEIESITGTFDNSRDILWEVITSYRTLNI